MLLLNVVLSFFVSVQTVSADISYPVDYPKDHCVAWKTKKTMFLFKKLEPVGISCDVKTEILKNEQGEPFLNVSVPIKSFDSGETKRDNEVIKILKADKQSDLIFKTTEALKVYNSDKEFEGVVKGEIIIGGDSFPLTFKVSKIKDDGQFYYKGLAVLKYTDLKIDPPSVAGGAVAKVKNYLELHFKFTNKKILKSL
jgi:hypothetical protein